MKRIFTLLALTLPFFTVAHNGHGIFDGNNFFHYILNAEHGIITLLIVAVIAFALYRNKKKAVSQ